MSEQKIVAFNQDYKCNICKTKLPPTFELDHIIPRWKQGSSNDYITNGQALCPNCHSLTVAHPSPK